jgi:pimeloyl-ACP methyl ester carboxylesterase
MNPQSQLITAGPATLEVLHSDASSDEPARLCAAHPADPFVAGTAQLLADASGAAVVCVNPPGLGASPGPLRPSLEQIVDELEAVRLALGGPRWVFWGLSGGGWLGQLWAHRHPQALAGLILESTCACFRERLADPACALSPFFPAWQEALTGAGLLDRGSHQAPLGAQQATEWIELASVGEVFRVQDGPALLVSPMPQSAAMKQMMPAFFRFDARHLQPALRLPTLVLAGSEDPVVPLAQARALHQAIAGSSFVTIAQGGHVPTAQRHPQAAAAVQAFLAQLAH